MSQQRFLQRQIARVSSFGLGQVTEADEAGRASAITGSRAAPRTGLSTVLAQPLTSGATALLLAGGDNDAASILGHAPFLGG